MEVIGGGEQAVGGAAKIHRARCPQQEARPTCSTRTRSNGVLASRAPNKIICVGLNYRKHAEETNAPIPEFPILFNKFNNTLTGHQRDDRRSESDAKAGLRSGAGHRHRQESQIRVQGRCARPRVRLLRVNDLSARDLQLRTQQWLLGKTCDDFSPLGPYLVTADEVGNPNDLAIKATVNGEVRQNSNTSDMIFHCDEIVSYISQHMTLVPGDIILTERRKASCWAIRRSSRCI